MSQARITRFGNAWRGLGLSSGDRVALLIPDIREYLEADYGIMAAGLVRVPLDPRLTAERSDRLAAHAGARVLVTHLSFAEQVDGLIGEVETLEARRQHRRIGSGEARPRLRDAAGARLRPAASGGHGDDLATLNFSGGTTGAPESHHAAAS